jgi:hypothetical protein
VMSVHTQVSATYLLLQRQAPRKDAGPKPVPQEGNGSDGSSLAALVRGCLQASAGAHVCL